MLTKCVGCGKKLKDTKVRGLARCQTCGHFCHREHIGKSKYDREYYEKYLRYAETELGKKIIENRWKLVGELMPEGARILDYGCGCGSFIKGNSNGFRVFGHDINPHSPYKRDSSWVEEWDAITLFDVIEHIYHPDVFLNAMKSKAVFILTPCADRIDNEYHLTDWRHYKPDEHQHYFTLNSLIKMMESAKYKVKGFDYTEGKLRNPQQPGDLVTIWGLRE